MTTGETIKAARIKANMTQKELAEAAGVKQSHISRWESNKRGITMKNYKKLERALRKE